MGKLVCVRKVDKEFCSVLLRSENKSFGEQNSMTGAKVLICWSSTQNKKKKKPIYSSQGLLFGGNNEL